MAINKSTKYAINGALFLGIANAALNAIRQLNEIESDPGKKFSWEKVFLAGGKGAVLGGAAGFAAGTLTDYLNSKEKPIDTDSYLLDIVNTLKLDKNDKVFVNLSNKTNLLIELLNNHFRNELSEYPARYGSTEKGTALKDKFDIDISLLFKPISFSSTKAMYHTVFEFLKENVGKYDIIDVREQKKSIGVIVLVLNKEHKIDIVPIKRTTEGRNNTSGYLYVNKQSFLTDDSSYTKTDVPKLKSVHLNNTQRKIALVLKKWKNDNNLPLSSHLLENLILDAYAYNQSKLPKGLTQKITMVLQHIADKLEVAKIRSIENTNNILTNISDNSKYEIIEACLDAIESYQYQPNSVVDLFKVEV